jgi:hypothetical protein
MRRIDVTEEVRYYSNAECYVRKSPSESNSLLCAGMLKRTLTASIIPPIRLPPFRIDERQSLPFMIGNGINDPMQITCAATHSDYIRLADVFITGCKMVLPSA